MSFPRNVSSAERRSSIPRQLAASPMLVFAQRVEHAFDMSVQCPHDTDARKQLALRGARRNSVQRSTNGCLQIVELDESIRAASQFVGDHRWFASQTGNDADVDASALHGFEQRAEIPIAGKQHDVIDLVCDLQASTASSTRMLRLNLRRPSPSSNSFAG